jgi:hypothetical protein
MSLIRELRDSIVDPSVPASAVLRKAKILAATLGQSDFQNWLNHELNGYSDVGDLPSYRKLYAALLGTFAGPSGSSVTGYLVPVSMLPEMMKRNANELPMAQPLREIETLATSAGDGLRHPLPAEAVILARDTVRLSGPYVLVELYQPINRATLEGIVDAVRTRFLDFLLGLQNISAGILESETALAELPRAQVAHIFNLTVYGNHNVIATQSPIGQISLDTVQQNDLAALMSFLRSVGLTADDTSDLEGALTQDGKRERGTIGARVRDWIGKMLAKAVGGTWKIALETAPAILQEAIFRYYGWK